MARQMELAEPQVVAQCLNQRDKKRDRKRARLLDTGRPAPRRIPKDKASILKFRPNGKIGVILFGGAKAVQADQCRQPALFCQA